MTMNSLPAIPEEIRQLIGIYLDRQTLGTLIQVSRALHSSFIPLLWKQAELRGGFWNDYVGSGAGTTYSSTDNEGFAEKCRSQLPSPPPSPGLHSSSPSSLMIDLTLLKVRSRHIEHLTISAPIPSDYYTVAFPRLRTLILTDDYTSIGSPQDIVQLARLNPTIERLVINDIQSSLPAQFWETVFSQWKNPRTLCIRYSPISKDSAAVAALWKACTRFEDFELQGVDLPHYATVSPPTNINNNNSSSNSDSDDEDGQSSPLVITTFPKARRVHLLITNNARQTHPFFNPSQQLAMIQSCPNLREFVWDGSQFHIDSQLSSQFTAALHPNNPNGRTTCWPHLESLVLLHISFHRNDPLRRRRLAEILHAVPVLKSLQIRGGVWEPFAMNELRAPGRHFETLERVSVQGCKGFSSSMVHEVLSQCAGLREFCADFIYAQDVVLDIASSLTPTSGTGTSGGGGGGVQPWACQGRLKSLKICIYATPLDSTSTISSNSNSNCTARQALLQLATLTQLEHLDLRRNLVDERPLLNLTLASGLDALVALTHLKSFQFDDCCGSTGEREGWVMGEEEMGWMLNRWRILEEVTGPFRSPSMMDEEEVRATFNQRHIAYSSVGVVERH
ncbi:hypothetical protein K457DRAFT_139511 [Linnemannia elongata AG-77]|uniref:F-box domain-containing protein n=1 Tax=Linnemannia elongata AG-77 TaxID=1314771 RepID=A0A197JT20_9FUNG|nr:hypothetical protein K457DRAFT_139511 [Linnemannia elongata AG-77]